MNQYQKAVFLDKDGTLIVDVPYNTDPDKIILTANCINGLKVLQSAGYLLIIVTNQAGIAKGFFKEDALNGVWQKLSNLLRPHEVNLAAFYYCPHHPEGVVNQFAVNCNCRKPASGMLLVAAADMNIDLQSSWMIGDILNDIEAGNGAGCKSILINNGNETEWLISPIRKPIFKAKDINDAASFIVEHDSNQLAKL